MKTMGYKHNVFLSYITSYPFGDWVHKTFLPLFGPYLRNELCQKNEGIFVDREGILGGDDLPFSLKDALVHSRCLVAIWSPEYFMSPWCRLELAMMLHRERQLGYRTEQNPRGLIFPVIVHDGEHFPDKIKGMKIKFFDCRGFALVGKAFKDSDGYLEFQIQMKNWTRRIAKVINEVPPWGENWHDGLISDDLDLIPFPVFEAPVLE